MSFTRFRAAPALLLFVAPFLAACGGRFDREAVVTADSAGVAVVDTDGEQPLWTRETTWRLSPRPRIQVGNQPYDPGQRLYRAEHARLLPDGGIVVANRGFGDVRVFDAGGYHVQTVRMVADPTIEVGRPRRVWPFSPDTMVVYLEGGTLSLRNADWDSFGQIPIQNPPEFADQQLEPVGAFADGTLLFAGRVPMDPSLTGMQRRHMRLMRFGLDGRMIDSWGDYPAETEWVGDGVYVWGPTGTVTVSDSTVWYSPGDRWEVHEIGAGGRLLRVFRIDQPLNPVMQADRGAFRASAVRQLTAAGQENAESIVDSYSYADRFPTWSQIVVDDLGNVWLKGYRWFDLGADHLWTVFGSDGRYLGEVVTPYLLQVDEIGADYVLGRMADGRGNEAAYIYRLEKPEAPPS